MHDVFISYSSVDTVQAETVRSVLEKNGIPCWMAPRDIPGGSNYTKEIPVAIRGCQVFVLILSHNAQNSHWVLKELDSAVNLGKVILPFMLEDCQLNDEFNFLLTGAQRYSAYQKKSEAMETLISRIRAITDTDRTTPVEQPQPEPIPEEAPAPKPVWDGISKCPACGGTELEEMTRRIGKYTAKEHLISLLSLLLAAVGLMAGFLLSGIAYAIIVGSVVMDVVIAVLMIGGLVGGAILGKRIAAEQIRRQRVRRHICPHPFRCVSCRKEFLLEKM